MFEGDSDELIDYFATTWLFEWMQDKGPREVEVEVSIAVHIQFRDAPPWVPLQPEETAASPVFALLIISKAGSLIFHRTFPTTTPGTAAGTLSSSDPKAQQTTGTLGLPGTSTLTTNDYLVLAGTFHGVHAITRSLTPKVPVTSSSTQTGNSGRSWTYPDPSIPPSGIESLESSFFRLTVFQTLSGTKFLLFTDPSMPNTDVLMKGVYERYADYVCKNPFWQMEMPIRIESWERSIGQWLTRR